MPFGQRLDLTPRLFSLGLVVLLHLVAIWVLVAGFVRTETRPPELPPIQTTIIEEVVVQTSEPPPPPPPRIEMPPTSFVPPPEIRVRQPPPPLQTITAVSQEPVSRPPPVYTPQRVVPGINARRNCPEPVYPSISLRLGERGTVTLQFLIDVDGRVVESRVEESSGHARLDEAARRALARCRFSPGTVDGVPERAWAQIRYTWRIPD